MIHLEFIGISFLLPWTKIKPSSPYISSFWEESLSKSDLCLVHWICAMVCTLGISVLHVSFFLCFFIYINVRKPQLSIIIMRGSWTFNLSLGREMNCHSSIVKVVILHISLATISFISIYVFLTFKGDDLVDPDSLPTTLLILTICKPKLQFLFLSPIMTSCALCLINSVMNCLSKNSLVF